MDKPSFWKMAFVAFILFKATAVPSCAQTLATLVSLTNANNNLSPLVLGADGSFYGTTPKGGANGQGSVFKVTTAGALTTLYSFGNTATDGTDPLDELLQGADGNFYGTTSGGATSNGTVFRITSGGTLTTLYGFGTSAFVASAGSNPNAGLIQATNGNFYGTTFSGGPTHGGGTIFKITPGGTVTTLYNFDTTSTHGSHPQFGLIQASDGNFYGTTSDVNTNGSGTVFKITPGGALTTLYSFSGPDGQYPSTGLIQATDGNFYGATYYGGASGTGTAFRITPGGTLTTLFSGTSQYSTAWPGGLIQATDGNLYFTTGGGGSHGQGAVLKITLAGALTTLYSFSGGANGSNPTSLTQGADGKLYGTTTLGGANNAGAVFSLTLAAAPSPAPAISTGGIVPLDSSSSTIQSGEWVSIYGTNLASGTATWTGNFPTSLAGTSVTIDGKAAYLSFVSPGQINLQAPSDNATGPVPVTIATAGGIATATVTLAQFAPSFLLLDAKHVAGIILRSNGSGAYGGGAYDIIGPTGTSLGYATVAAKAGDIVELFATGLGPTSPVVQAGQAFSGTAATSNPVNLLINNVSVTPLFAGLSGAGLCQINLTVPTGLGSGDVPLAAMVGGVQTPPGVVISLQ